MKSRGIPFVKRTSHNGNNHESINNVKQLAINHQHDKKETKQARRTKKS